jgi:hypothetical protein
MQPGSDSHEDEFLNLMAKMKEKTRQSKLEEFGFTVEQGG